MTPTDPWTNGVQFDLPLSFTLLAYFTFGATGALAGLKRGYDVVGVLFLAMITAGGGGMIRDGLLLSSGPASMLTDPRNLIAVLAAAMLTRVFHGYVERLSRAVAVVDAAGLGAFAVVGVERTLAAGLTPVAAVVGGTLTAVGGGLLRDILVREEPLLFKPGQFYGLVAIGGSCLFLVLLRWGALTPNEAGLATIGTVFVIRMLVIRFNWHSNALYRAKTPGS